MKISQWPKGERPREKLLAQGAAALSDSELLAIFLRTGIPGFNAIELAQLSLQKFGSLRQLFNATEQDFCEMKGLGQAKFVQLQASLEMSKRYMAERLNRTEQFQSVSDTEQYLLAKLRDELREVFALLMLDSQHRLIKFQPMFFGTIDSAAVYPRVLVQQVLKDNAAAVILAHNHPSGVAEPSQADIHITEKIKQAFALIDVKVLDHFVIGDGVAVSLAQRGMM